MIITFSIPNRGLAGLPPNDPNFRYEVGRLKLSIPLAASPAGATLTYNGTAVALGGFANIGGDLLDFAQVGAANEVRIELLLQSDFTGGDFRTYDYAANPNPRTVTLDLSGGGTPTALRWGAYAAATDFGGSAYRRVSGSASATSFIAVTTSSPSLPASNSRLPLDVVFVMDRSGSMDANVPSTTTQKFDLLQDSINQFIDAFALEATSQDDDRLALVWFESTATTESFGGDPWVPKSSGWVQVQNAVTAQSTAGSTAMGDGVSQGVDIWVDDNSTIDPMLVLFTDGMQNAGNQIIDQGMDGFLDYFDLNDSAYQPLRHRAIPMGAIGIGVPAAYAGTLQNISTQTGGGLYVDAQPAVIGFGFHEQLISALKGNTLALLAQAQGKLNRGQPAAGPVAFVVGKDVPQVMFCMYWLGSENRNALDLAIFRPDGTQVGPDKRADGPFYTVQSIDKPEPGVWKVLIVRNKAGGQGDVPYYLSVLGTEGPFRLNMRSWAKAYIAGAEIFTVLELDENDRPLNLKKARGRITLQVRAPQIDVGSLLDRLEMPSFEELIKVLGDQLKDIESPLELKLAYYSKTGVLGPLLLPDKVTEEISFEVGPEAKAPDGVQFGEGGVSIRFAGTTYSGTYRFHAIVELETGGCGTIVRQEDATVYLDLGPISPKRTIVRGKLYASRLTRYAYLSILAYDEAGNLLGSGFDSVVDVDVRSKSSRVEYVPNTEGSAVYTFRILGLRPKEDPQVEVRVRGQTVRRERLSALLTEPPGVPVWWRRKLTAYKRAVTARRKRRFA